MRAGRSGNPVESDERAGHLLRDVLDTLQSGVLVVDGAGTILEANAAAEERTGVERRRLVGASAAQYVGTVARRCDGTVRLGGPDGSGPSLRVARRDLPGEPGAEIIVLRATDGPEDASAAWSSEVAARLSDLSMLGHRINNPLTVLLGRMQILRLRKAQGDPDLMKLADIVEDCSRRIADDIRTLSSVIREIRRSTVDRVLPDDPGA